MLQTKKLLKSLSQISTRVNAVKKHRIVVVEGMLLCICLLFAGCASSDLVDVWSDPSFQPPSLKKMLVISVGKDPVKRRIWEDAFSIELANHNVAATPSYRLFPDLFPDTTQVIGAVRSNGFDGVLVTRWLPSEIKTQYLEGSITSEQNLRYDRRNDRFVTYYRDIVYPGYFDSTKVDIRTIDVWATKEEGRMIWSGTSQTPEPNSMEEARSEIVKLVMTELTRQGIIAGKR